jgi:head-tail adaptor
MDGLCVKYHKRAIFERRTPIDDVTGTGGQWQQAFQAFIGLEPLRGSEYIEAQKLQAVVSHKVCTHWRDGVTTKGRLKIAKYKKPKPLEPDHDDNFRIFHVVSVINVGEMDRELELMVIERT